jgi:hypothetical protein
LRGVLSPIDVPARPPYPPPANGGGRGRPAGAMAPPNVWWKKLIFLWPKRPSPSTYHVCTYTELRAKPSVVRSFQERGLSRLGQSTPIAIRDSRFTILPQTAVPPAPPHSPSRPPPALKGTCRLQSAPPSGFQPSRSSRPGSTQHGSR